MIWNNVVTKWHWAIALLLCSLMLTLEIGAAVQAQSSTPTPTVTVATVLYDAGLRAGPGAAQAIVGEVRAGETIQITAVSPDRNWVQLADGAWLATFFVKSNILAVSATVTATAPRLLVATATPIPNELSQLTPTITITRDITAPLTATLPVTHTLEGLTTSLPTAPRLRATTTPTQVAGFTALRNANLRAGPGTNYTIVGGVRTGETLTLQGRTGDGTWLQLRNGRWIAAFLVEQNAGALPTVAPTLIAAIPTALPTATSTSQPTEPPAETLSPTAESAPADPTAEPSTPPNNGTATFVVTRRRLWNPWENGGSLDGPSVHCGQGRNLMVNVLDENGNRLNGVAVQAEYGAKEIHVTGAQGKGDGVVEFVLGGGQDIKVIRDADGTPVTSEVARGLSTDPRGIDQESLMSAGYCQDDESCRTFVNNLSCIGHYSWTVTFERRR